AINDRYPVTPGHLLVIPKRYVASYFDLVSSELKACNELLHEARSAIRSTDSTVTGFNIGINDGYAAGQTIFHCHIHLIPRRDGDMEQPQGGVRGVISARQHY
ncbi:MAG TPA: HIT domain-containing protein, partial [Chlorobaculum parvum]|nr:HIT domain-containing protein [Chlorobaculum parvum]